MLSNDLDRGLEDVYVKKCEHLRGRCGVVTVVELNGIVMDAHSACFMQINIFKHLQARHECDLTLSSFFSSSLLL